MSAHRQLLQCMRLAVARLESRTAALRPMLPLHAAHCLLLQCCPPATQPTYAVSDIGLVKVASAEAQAVCGSNNASDVAEAYDAGMAVGDAGMRVCVRAEPITSPTVPVAGKFVSDVVSGWPGADGTAGAADCTRKVQAPTATYVLLLCATARRHRQAFRTADMPTRLHQSQDQHLQAQQR